MMVPAEYALGWIHATVFDGQAEESFSRLQMSRAAGDLTARCIDVEHDRVRTVLDGSIDASFERPQRDPIDAHRGW